MGVERDKGKQNERERDINERRPTGIASPYHYYHHYHHHNNQPPTMPPTPPHLPPPRPSFSQGTTARPSTDSIRSLVEHAYSPLVSRSPALFLLVTKISKLILSFENDSGMVVHKRTDQFHPPAHSHSHPRSVWQGRSTPPSPTSRSDPDEPDLPNPSEIEIEPLPLPRLVLLLEIAVSHEEGEGEGEGGEGGFNWTCGGFYYGCG